MTAELQPYEDGDLEIADEPLANVKYSDDEPRDGRGRWTDGGSGEVSSSRAQRALRTHKPATAEKQRWADKNAHQVARYVGGQHTDDNEPADVLVKSGRTLHGIEVKTMLDNSNDKVTMHPASIARKEAWAAQHDAKLHTVILDDRNRFGTPGHSGNRLYYREGIGSFRLGSMTPVSNAAQLKQLMGLRKRSYDIVLPNGQSVWIGEHFDAKFNEDEPRDDHGRWTDGGGGSSSEPSAAEREHALAAFHGLKANWARVNNSLIEHMDHPDAPVVQEKMNELKGLVKQMYQLNADPGGIEGIGLPGGARDMVIVGAGPGGLAAAVMGGTDGMDTLLIDASTQVGGQAKYSSRIENYPGFPVGVTGHTLAENMYQQAERVGADTKLGVRVTGLTYDPKTELKTLTLSNGEQVTARSVVLAGGVEFKKLSFPGSDAERVIYGDGERLMAMGAGKTVVVVGGSNGAAQAALAAARTANNVYLVSRSPIAQGMSDYQVSALHASAKITVIEHDEIHSLHESHDILELKSGKKVDCHALGIFVGGAPNLSWLPKDLKVTNGKVKVNHDLETSIPGVFAVGDARQGSIGRIGSAVGDGQMAQRNVWQYFKRAHR